MNKKGQLSPPVIAFIVLIVAVIVVLFSFRIVDLASITGSGDYIERPVFKYVKCEAVGSLKYSTDYSFSSGTWAIKPTATNQYSVILKAEDFRSLIDDPYFSYSICNSRVDDKSNCRVFGKILEVTSKGQTFQVSDLRNDEYLRIEYRSHPTLSNGFKDKGINGATYQVGFIPYGLREYNVLSGSSQQINPNSCEVATNEDSWKFRIINEDLDKVDTSRNVNERILQPEEVRWSVAGYVTSAEPSFALRYKGQDAWCRSTGSNAEIYSINEIQTGSGTYKVASADYSDYLGSVTCCPGDKRGDETCNENFKWESTKGSQCSAFNPCGGAEWTPYSEGQLIRYSCDNGFCIANYQNVECANDFDCKDSNEVCDLNSYKCVQANVNLDGEVIETIPDNKADCDKKGGTWITKTSKKRSVLSLLNLKDPEVIVEEYCKLKKPFNWVLWISVALILFLIIAFRDSLTKYLRLIFKF